MRIVRSIAGILAVVMFMLSAVSGLSFASNIVITDEEIDPETGLMFTLLEDGTYSVSCPIANRGKLVGELVIPGEYNGKSVTEIGREGFYACVNLTSVIISSGIETIWNSAFEHCVELESVSISESVVSFGNLSLGLDTFLFCDKIAEILVDGNNEKYCSDNGVLLSKDRKSLLFYPSGKPDEDYSIPLGVERLERLAFQWCSNLVSVTFSEKVKK